MQILEDKFPQFSTKPLDEQHSIYPDTFVCVNGYSQPSKGRNAAIFDFFSLVASYRTIFPVRHATKLKKALEAIALCSGSMSPLSRGGLVLCDFASAELIGDIRRQPSFPIHPSGKAVLRKRYRCDAQSKGYEKRRDGERDAHTSRNSLRTRCHQVSRRPPPSANTVPITEAPVMSPRLRDRLSRPEMTPRWSGGIFVMTAVLLAAWNSAYPAVSTSSGPTYPGTPKLSGSIVSKVRPRHGR